MEIFDNIFRNGVNFDDLETAIYNRRELGLEVHSMADPDDYYSSSKLENGILIGVSCGYLGDGEITKIDCSADDEIIKSKLREILGEEFEICRLDTYAQFING